MSLTSPTLIHHFLEESTQRYPDKIALIHDSVRATYSDINSRANILARHLIDMGVIPGDRIAILFENCLEYVVSYYASLKAGAVAVPLNSELKPESLTSILYELQPKCIISSSRFERLLQATELKDCGIQEIILKAPGKGWSNNGFKVEKLEEVLQESPQADPIVEIQESDLASIIYTSGSTGRPKGVMLSHRNIVSNTLSICQYLQLTPDDIQMVVLPFFYVMGKSLLNTHFAAGGTVVINNKFAFPATVLNEMVAENVTGFSGVPSTYAYLLHRSPLASFREKLPNLRYCSQAGGHMARAVKEKLREALPSHTELYVMYGATEASARLSYLEPEFYLDKMDSIGKPISSVTLYILGPDGNHLPPGQSGELVASGPNIMLGYWKDPEATAKALDKTLYHTGDQAYMDSDGFFYVTGRRDDILKVGGHRINTREIEDVLMESDYLMETIVFGIPDDLLGHRLTALAVFKNNNCTENELLGYCARRLPKHKLPTEIRVTRALPKNASGKVDRSKCFDLLYSGALA